MSTPLAFKSLNLYNINSIRLEGFAQRVDFVFDLEYFNIFSSKRILFILYKLSDLKASGVDINVIWHFSLEDDDMKEVGEDFACMVNLPFEFVSNTLYSEYA
jgi:hypothetical protein